MGAPTPFCVCVDQPCAVRLRPPLVSWFDDVNRIDQIMSCQGISMKREFRVCDEQDTIHVREDISQGGDTMSHKEARIPKKFIASAK